MTSSNGNIFPRYWPFVLGIHQSPVNSPNKGQWHGALMFSLICAWINGWINNREAGDLRRHRAHYDVNVMNLFTLMLSYKNSLWWNMKVRTEAKFLSLASWEVVIGTVRDHLVFIIWIAGLPGKPFKPFLTFFWRQKTFFPNFCEKPFLAGFFLWGL